MFKIPPFFKHFAAAAPLLLVVASSSSPGQTNAATENAQPAAAQLPKRPLPFLNDTLVVTLDVESGKCWTNQEGPDVLLQRFPQASLNKLVIIRAALELIRDGKLSPNTEVVWTDYARTAEGSTLRNAIFKYNRERKERLRQQAERNVPEGEREQYVEGRYSAIPVPQRISVLELIESAKKGSHNDSTRLLAQVLARKWGFAEDENGIKTMMQQLLSRYGLRFTTANDPAGMTDEDLPLGVNSDIAHERDLRVGMFSNAQDMLTLAVQTLNIADDAQIVRTNALDRVFRNTHLQINDFAGSDHFAKFLQDRGLFLIKTGTQEDNYHIMAASRDGRRIYAVFGADNNDQRRSGIDLAIANQRNLDNTTQHLTGVRQNCTTPRLRIT